jgi:hypothetical protein
MLEPSGLRVRTEWAYPVFERPTSNRFQTEII